MSKIPLVRNSERTDFMRCRQRWYWGFVDQIRPVGRSSPLEFGDLIHQSLAAFYIPELGPNTRKKGRKFRGPHPAETFNNLYNGLEEQGLAFNVKSGADDDNEKWGDARNLGTTMLEGYIKEYGNDERYKVIAPEMSFKLPIVDPITKKVLCYAVGQGDCVVLDLETNFLGLLEHKTAAHIVTTHLALDEQTSTYWAFFPPFLKQQELMRKEDKLDFILFNFMRKGYPDDRPKDEYGRALNKPTKEAMLEAAERWGVTIPAKAKTEVVRQILESSGFDVGLLGEVSRVQPKPLFERKLVYREAYEGRQFLDRFINQVREMNMIREGKLAPHKSPLGGCTGMLGCQYRDMCEQHEIGANWELLRDLTMVKWDPYENQIEMR